MGILPSLESLFLLNPRIFYSVSNWWCIFQGTYKNYECGIEVSNADAEDDGEWTCEIESWVKRGKRGDGDVARVRIYTNNFCHTPAPKKKRDDARVVNKNIYKCEIVN